VQALFSFGFPVGCLYYKRGYAGDVKITRAYKKNTMRTCLSTNCLERYSICCDKISRAASEGEIMLGVPVFFCSGCGEEFVGGECTAGENDPDIPRRNVFRTQGESKAWQEGYDFAWIKIFDSFYDHTEGLGSSAWFVAPSTVEVFIKGLVRKNTYDSIDFAVEMINKKDDNN